MITKELKEANQTVGRIKTHFRENKKTYFAVGAGFAVGATSILVLTSQGPKAVQLSPFSFAWKSTLVQTAVLTRRGHPGVVIRDELTGELYASIRRAAEATGINRQALRDQMGERFTKLGDAV